MAARDIADPAGAIFAWAVAGVVSFGWGYQASHRLAGDRVSLVPVDSGISGIELQRIFGPDADITAWEAFIRSPRAEWEAEFAPAEPEPEPDEAPEQPSPDAAAPPPEAKGQKRKRG